MNKLIKYIIMITLPFGVAHANKATVEKRVEASPSLQAQELKSILSKERLKGSERVAVYEALGKLIDNRANPSMKELLQLCLLYSKHDQSDAPYHLANSLKTSSPAEFEEALKQMSKEDASKIIDFVEISDSMKDGNG